MTPELIAHPHPFHGKVLARVEVHNPAGECSVRLTPEGRLALQQADAGHFLLDLFPQQGDEAVASVTIKVDGKAKSVAIYPERTVPDLAVGVHDLVAICFLRPGTAPRPRRP